MSRNNRGPQHAFSGRGWQIIALASLILLITMGVRQTMSLFVEPLIANTSLNIVNISLALAFNQLLWGVFQPIMGMVADKKGPMLVLVIGSLILMAGQLAVVWVDSSWSILLVWGVLAPAGAAAGGFSILMSQVRHLPLEKRSMASAIISSGASLGQFLFAPMVQLFIAVWGYISALFILAGFSLANLPLAIRLCRLSNSASEAAAQARLAPAARAEDTSGKLKSSIKLACQTPGFWFLNSGFFLGGVHVGFIITHLPGEVAAQGVDAAIAAWSLGLIGLFNIGGTLLTGFLGNRFSGGQLLSAIYLSRALLIAVYLLSPKTDITFYIFSAVLGLNWLATVPPTAGVMANLCGMRYFATLFGISLLAHQTGAFLGAFTGGAVMSFWGSYAAMWWLNLVLSVMAAILSRFAHK